MGIIAPLSRIRVLARSAVAASHTGSTAEVVLATIPIPAGMLGLNGILRVTTFWTLTNSANAKTARVRLGGLAGASFQTITYTTNANAHLITSIANRNAQNSQLGTTFGNRATDAVYTLFSPVTGTVDTSVAQDLVISGQLAVTTETVTLSSHLVELLMA